MITVEVNKYEEVKPEDIFYQGNVVSTVDGCIVLISCSHPDNQNLFHGQCIKSVDTIYGYGGYCDNWIKSSFTQFTGTITITSK
mgnify:CR=1 FL=1